MNDLLRQLQTAIRQLQRHAGFSITAIVTLGIGIGATTAIFSIFYAVLLRPLPYTRPDRVVSLTPMVKASNRGGSVEDDVSYPNFRDWRDRAHSFTSMASYHAGIVVLNSTGSTAARNLQIGVASSDFFPTLDVRPALGRGFLRSEEQAGNRVVILSHELWSSSFHSSPDVVGSSIRLSDEPYTVVGVLPEGAKFPFFGSTPMELWTTPAFDAVGKQPSTVQRGWNQLEVVARLRDDVSMAQAKVDMDSIEQSLAKQYPDEDGDAVGVKITPTLDKMVGDVRPALHILFVAVGALLLIACANVAGLLLARGSVRQTELAVRAALGASRARITLQLLIESLLLSLMGGLVGMLVAFGCLKAMLSFVPKNLPRIDDIAINMPVLLFAVAMSMTTGVVFGLLPARRLSKLDPALALRGARTSTAGRHQHRLHSALVIIETALGLVLLIGAGLLIRSFVNLLNTDPGFNPQHLLTFRIGLSDKSYTPEKKSQLFDDLFTKLNSLPGVKSSTAAFPLPFSGGDMNLTFDIEGRVTKPIDAPAAHTAVVEPEYFETMQILLLHGRLFTKQDEQATAFPVTVINEAMAKKFFSNGNAIGKRIQSGFDSPEEGKPGRWREIVGIVQDVKRSNLAEAPQPEFYVPFSQAPIATPYVAMRVDGNPASYVHTVELTVAGLDKQVPVYRLRAMEENVANASAQPRFQAMLLSAFAAVALLLAAVGLYAVLSYMVAQRTHEIGLRMALGAGRSNVLAMIMRRGINLALAGLVVGMAISVALTRLLADLLYGVKPLDPLTFVTVALILLGVSAFASILPASRAANLDPMQTLRNE